MQKHFPVGWGGGEVLIGVMWINQSEPYLIDGLPEPHIKQRVRLI
jgi:hypothetical protein